MDNLSPSCDPLAEEIIAEQAAEYQRDMRRLDDISFALLNATGGDIDAAVQLLDDFIKRPRQGWTLLDPAGFRNSAFRYRAGQTRYSAMNYSFFRESYGTKV